MPSAAAAFSCVGCSRIATIIRSWLIRLTLTPPFHGPPDFACALFCSCECLDPLGPDLLEGTTIPVTGSLLAGQRLPAQDRDIDILWIKLQAVADAVGQFRRRERGPAPQERLIDQLATASVV